MYILLDAFKYYISLPPYYQLLKYLHYLYQGII